MANVTGWRRIDPRPGDYSLALSREIPGKPGGWAVTVELDGGVARFDRRDDETRWHLAAEVNRVGIPVREHGDLSRCTIPVYAAHELAAVLDATVATLAAGGVA